MKDEKKVEPLWFKDETTHGIVTRNVSRKTVYRCDICRSEFNTMFDALQCSLQCEKHSR